MNLEYNLLEFLFGTTRLTDEAAPFVSTFYRRMKTDFILVARVHTINIGFWILVFQCSFYTTGFRNLNVNVNNIVSEFCSHEHFKIRKTN